MEGLVMKYFILKPKSKYIGDKYASASRMAMRAYAREILSQNSVLAKDLMDWASAEEMAAEQMPSIKEMLVKL